jgi:hypothetical protein
MLWKKEMPKSHEDWIVYWQREKKREAKTQVWQKRKKDIKTFFSKLFKIKNI